MTTQCDMPDDGRIEQALATRLLQAWPACRALTVVFAYDNWLCVRDEQRADGVEVLITVAEFDWILGFSSRKL